MRLGTAVRLGLALSVAAALTVPGCHASGPAAPRTRSTATDAVRGVHDPAAIRRNGVYWLYSTGAGIPIRRSTDLVHWDTAGRVFGAAVPAWATTAVPGVQFPWAPDVSLIDGQYRLYYSLSTFGSQHSVIGLATNSTLDPGEAGYHWNDAGAVLESQPGISTFNAIDPNVALDERGDPWLAWGSFWGGIKLRRLDRTTGKLSASDSAVHSLAARAGTDATAGPTDAQAIEAPYIVRHGAYFYLFASYDLCCRGSSSTYNVRVGRSVAITGPYVDKAGVAMTAGGGTVVLESLGRVRGPGHCAVIGDGTRDYMLHHFYDDLVGGVATLQVRPVTWTADDWPVVGEPLAPPPVS